MFSFVISLLDDDVWNITTSQHVNFYNYYLSHGIENTANQKARDPLHMQQVVLHEKFMAFLAAYKFFPPKDRLKSLWQVKIFIQFWP